MCLKYRKGDGTYYARLCAKTGEAGVHRDLTTELAANWEWGMFHQQSGARRSSKKQFLITFDVGTAPEAVPDMARYMGSNQFTTDPINGHVTFWVEHGVTPNDIRRAESFGWIRIESVPASDIQSEPAPELVKQAVENQFRTEKSDEVEKRRQMVEDWLKDIKAGEWKQQ